MYMFQLDENNQYLNDHYQSYKESGEILPYDGPKRTAKDDLLHKQAEEKQLKRATK